MRGYNTEFICGEDSQSKREDCIDRLTSDIRPDKLDYIFTVDIFNEGVDIPEINQVVMLRPTESPIIFVQQLGRGLRKAPGKEYDPGRAGRQDHLGRPVERLRAGNAGQAPGA